MSGASTGLIVGQNKLAGFFFGLLAWVVGLLIFFPIFWMVLSGFKEVAEGDPKLFFDPTLEQFRKVTADTEGTLTFSESFFNSTWAVGISTLIVMVLAIPAAYSLSIRPIVKWRDVLFFFISTKFLPIVAAIVPLYSISQYLDLFNTRLLIVTLYTAMNLPLAVWMLRSFFQEVPKELIEAAQIDGCGIVGQIRSVVLPIVAPGLAATALLCVIFGWNEYFLAVQLTTGSNGTMPVWVASNITGRDNFLAQLSAASTIAALPVVIAGWIAQKRMIRGLAMGAIK